MGVYIPNIKPEQFYELCKQKGIEIIAVPVPPHGRLIDADALIKANERSYDHFKNGDEISVQESTIAYLWASEIIRNAPTIIPAEGGET